MGLHHRKLLSCELFCHDVESCSTNCDDCIKDCNSYHPPPPPSLDHTKHKTSTYLIISFSIVAVIFLFLCCYAFYVKFFSHRNRSRRRTLLTRQQTEHGFAVDEQHDDGSVVDHPIWYIRTPGLQQSIINAITVVKFKKGEGLIDGSDCSVCLSEFEEDENLRLLPKCNHAFHLPCIDTWLGSHTSCPMCRAPIVVDPLRIPSMDPNVHVESFRMEVVENSAGNGNGIGDSVVDQLRNGEEEEEGEEVEENESSRLEMVNIQPRRSVSFDSSSAAKINLALSNSLAVEESQGNSTMKQVGEVNEQVVSKRVDGNDNMVNLHSAPSSMDHRSRSFNGKHLLSLYSSNQKKINVPPRSF